MKIKRDTIIKILMILFLLAIIGGIIIYILNLNTETFENYNFYQYFAGRKIEYEGTLMMTSKDGITSLTCKNYSIQLDSTPIYYRDVENKAIFPENMEIVIPSENGQVYKINRFSNIFIQDGVVYLEYREKMKELSNSFIYDGSDLYFFTTNATLEVDDTSYEISPLSYIIAINKNSIELYNKAKDEYTTIQTANQAIVKTEDYSINVSLDTIKYGEKEQLLLRKFDDLVTINMD